MRRFSAVFPWTLCLLPLVAGGCLGTSDEGTVGGPCYDHQGQSFAACREFRGRFLIPHASQLITGMRVGQVAAFGAKTAGAKSTADGGVSTAATAKDVTWRFFGGDALGHQEGAGFRASIPFSVVVPCAVSVNLTLQLHVDGAGALPGEHRALMQFATDAGGKTLSSLIPAQSVNACGKKTNSWDLGDVTWELTKKQAVNEGSITLGKGKSKNPLSLLDTDGDGTSDLDDSDDDSDGKSDYLDRDENGDGIVDAAQDLAAMTSKARSSILTSLK